MEELINQMRIELDHLNNALVRVKIWAWPPRHRRVKTQDRIQDILPPFVYHCFHSDRKSPWKFGQATTPACVATWTGLKWAMVGLRLYNSLFHLRVARVRVRDTTLLRKEGMEHVRAKVHEAGEISHTKHGRGLSISPCLRWYRLCGLSWLDSANCNTNISIVQWMNPTPDIEVAQILKCDCAS